ncbi:MAG: hypothetical protein WCR72_04840 [Bacteroidota bacterium]
MKKVALVISLFAIIFAFTLNTVSAQKVTSAEKAKTEKVSSSKESTTPAKACCSKGEAKSGACAKEGEKAGCSKSCTKAEGKSCCKKGEAKTETAPVPKTN